MNMEKEYDTMIENDEMWYVCTVGYMGPLSAIIYENIMLLPKVDS